MRSTAELALGGPEFAAGYATALRTAAVIAGGALVIAALTLPPDEPAPSRA